MQSEKEYDEFCRWYESATRDGAAGRQTVYGRTGVVRSNGRMKRTRYKVGTLIVTPDGIAFLRTGRSIPWWGIVLIVLGFAFILALGTVIGFYTDRTPIFIIAVPTLGIVFGIGWWTRRPMDLGDPATLRRSAGDTMSAFVPMERITGVGQCRPPGWANPDHLLIEHLDAEGNRRELIVGDMVAGSVHFDIRPLLQTLTEVVNNEHPD